MAAWPLTSLWSHVEFAIGMLEVAVYVYISFATHVMALL